MAKFNLQGVQFVASAPSVEKLPTVRDESGNVLPEVAVIGRSNVGKSSLLNMVFNTKSLVKTSSTPGKTRAINIFALKDTVAFADLPGYGYAAVSNEIQKEWAPMIKGYFERRKGLTVTLFLFDIRRDPNEEDRRLMQWLANQDKAVILVITKTDKVSKGQVQGRCKRILAGLGVENLHFIACSALKKEGRDNLLRMLSDALQNESQSNEQPQTS
ncbi:MAG: ribosome biogenesis GTP-binding protein YihA/YsxC [Parachlamydiales bacterium]|jgi:GTP-binding protein